MADGAAAARQRLVLLLSEALQEHVKLAAPVGRPYGLDGASRTSGTLRDSLAFQVGPDGAALMGAGHALYVIGGTAPHAIHVRNAKALRFWWARRGRVFVGASVNHPGNAPNDFRRRALQAAFDDGTITRAASSYWQDLRGG